MVITRILRATTDWRCGVLAGLLALLAVTAGGPPATAAQEARLTADQQAAVQRMASYFNQLRSLQGEFVQIGPRGQMSKGVFYLKKPGRLRFEYAPPNPFLVVSDGDYVIVNNRKSEEADYYPLSQTPLRMVLANDIDLGDEARVLDVNSRDGYTSVTLEDRNMLVPGQLTVVFDDKTNELRQWIIVDGNGNKTTISLTKLASGVNPDPSLFKVKIPRKIETGPDRR
ncbi:outer-membrane lipoprotein carrier protein LolA [Kaustia mangrovi]|uniref:Outer-membrane lipoprotein carrier protein LolA n=1 Tax=Kaustia mangrovi TaxID=2593653 RepID=A0A7S8C4T7_9HYPH|nr:outer membrane lipoprotein carrier protein LolA [Kaustia mangrovi]QPC43341.1 outer-membrane lipoprotein carrier protein LolA [Kaustia mangrovi]